MPPKQQADAYLSQDNPVSGTKYTVLDTVKNARIISAAVKVTWTVQPTPLELHLTIDSVPFTYGFTNPVSATVYVARSDNEFGNETSQLLSTTALAGYRAFFIEGRSVKVEMETTGGTVSNITGRVRYALW